MLIPSWIRWLFAPGLNVPADGIPRDEQQCIFYNSDFIIYSSLSSFYIPCVIMVCLYYRIFQVRGFPTRFGRAVVTGLEKKNVINFNPF